ncbi:hypothetical protein ADP8_05223 (plasmid) [Roseomonas mucosa]|nr:hypothetical protein ADP8_05223 [Roseomonas mucosa]
MRDDRGQRFGATCHCSRGHGSSSMNGQLKGGGDERAVREVRQAELELWRR